MLKLNIWCIRFKSNYSSCTCKSNENICKEKYSETQFTTKIDGFFFNTPLPFKVYVFCYRFLFLESHHVYDHWTQGSNVVFSLTLWIILLYIPLMTIPSYKSILISYKCVFWFFFLQWAIWLAYHQFFYNIPPSQIKIAFFTLTLFYIVVYKIIWVYLFYIYTILHDYIKPYWYIYFYIRIYTILHGIKYI